MTMKNDAKFEEELTCHFKIGMRNSMNFDPSTLKVSKVFILMCSFSAKYILFELKKYRGVSFMKLKWDAKLGEESTCRLKIGIRNLTNCDPSPWKSQKDSF